jgi:hypothetical protein
LMFGINTAIFSVVPFGLFTNITLNTHCGTENFYPFLKNPLRFPHA